MYMKKGVRNQENQLFLNVFLFMIFFWIFNDFGIRYIYGYAVLGIVLFIQIALLRVTIRCTKIKLWFSLLVVAVVTFSLLPSSNLNNTTMSLTISMSIFWLYTLFAKTNSRQVLKGFWAIKLISLFFSIYLIVTKIVPSLYWDYIFPRLGSTTQAEAKRLIHLGYGVPIGASSTYADYLIVVSILILLGEYMFTTNKAQIRKRVLIVLNLAIYLAAMLVVNRRSEVFMIFFTVGFLFILLMNPYLKKDFTKKIRLLLKIIFIAFIAVIICLYIGLLERFVNTFTLIFSEKATHNELSNGRIALWGIAWSLFKEKPFWGIGWEQFMNFNYYEHDVHNSYLQFLCETGFIGFILLFIPIVILLVQGILQLRKFIRYNSKEFNLLKQINLVGVGIQLFCFFINLIDPAFYHLNYFCFYSFSIILLNYCYEREHRILKEEKCCI